MLKSLPTGQRPLVYIGGHFIGSIIAMGISLIWWKYELAHFAFLCFLFFSMIYSGGHHYYDVYFAKLKKQGVPLVKVRASMYEVSAAADFISNKNE